MGFLPEQLVFTEKLIISAFDPEKLFIHNLINAIFVFSFQFIFCYLLP